jgi:hypothetical protein
MIRTRSEACKGIVQENKLTDTKAGTRMFNSKLLVRLVEYAISDSGATSHFLIKDAPVVNTRVNKNNIRIKLPNGNIIYSTNTCNLDILWLPHHLIAAHSVPDLAHSSLVSTRKFCNAGCKVTFNEDTCKVYHKGIRLLTGGRDSKSQLWQLPINSIKLSRKIESIGPQVTPIYMKSHNAFGRLHIQYNAIYPTAQTTPIKIHAPLILQCTSPNHCQYNPKPPTRQNPIIEQSKVD